MIEVTLKNFDTEVIAASMTTPATIILSMASITIPAREEHHANLRSDFQ